VAVAGGSIILSANQSGGQTAHVIHNNYGTAPEQASPFRRELAARHLADVENLEVGRTTYHMKMGMVGQHQKIQPLRTTAIFFAHSPQPFFAASDEGEVLRWADTNKRRYQPCTTHPFIRGVVPDRVGSALVWNDGGSLGGYPMFQFYSCYLAL